MKYGRPDIVHWYENPYKKALRRLIARQDNIWTSPRSYLKGLSNVPIKIGDNYIAGIKTLDDASAPNEIQLELFDDASIKERLG